MNAKLALKSVLAFTLALVAGHFMFAGRSTPSAQRVGTALTANDSLTPPTAVGYTSHAPLVKTTLPSARVATPVGGSINRDIVKVENGFVNKSGRMNTVFMDTYQAGIVHSDPHRNLTVGWKPASQEVRRGTEVLASTNVMGNSEARLEERNGSKQVVYPSTYAETDERLYVRQEDGGVEHDIVLKKQPPVPEGYELAYSGYLELGKGLTLWNDDVQITENYTTKGQLYFKDRIGNKVFRLRAPVAYDAAVTTAAGAFDREKTQYQAFQKCAISCDYQVTFDAKGVKLAVVTPGKWLSDKDRAYPVTIDPNFGPNGLTDGSPPIYTGTVSTGVLIPLAGDGTAAGAGGTKLAIDEQCPGSVKGSDEYGHIPMPFDFIYYGTTFRGPNNPNGPPDLFFIHTDGWASWDPPAFKFCDEIPCNPAESPCFDFPQAANNFGAIPKGAYPVDGALYALWNHLAFSNDQASAMYYLVDGTAPTRRLIIEWHKMAYIGDNNAQDIISFNLILYECTNQIDIVIGDLTNGNKYHGTSTIGIENPGATRAAAYDIYSAPALGSAPTTDLTGILISFTLDTLSTVNFTVTPNPTSGTIPFPVTYKAFQKIVQNPLCPVDVLPGNISYHWIFGDGEEAFSMSGTHVYVLPNRYLATMRATDGTGAFTVFQFPTAVIAADVPNVAMDVSPQGGPAPLKISVTAKSTAPLTPNQAVGNQRPTMDSYITDAALNPTTTLQVDRVDSQNFPGAAIAYATQKGSNQSTVPAYPNSTSKTTTIQNVISSTFLLDQPGTYRITGIFPGLSFTFPTTGEGVVYVDVTDPNTSISNALIITQSNLHINFLGKIQNKLGVAPKPADDTISVSGYLNLVGLDLSTLAGQEITLALNGYNPIFQGVLDGNGNATQGDFSTGQTGNFAISMPSGKFTCNVKGDLAGSLALTSQNLITMLTAHYRVQIGNVFNTPGTSISYGYQSVKDQQGAGNYTFGKFYKNGSFYRNGIPGAPKGSGNNGGQEVLISGGFLVTNADFILQGDTVSCTISGLMARAGGDDLRPKATSNVIVGIGNSTQTLNFSTTPGFKAVGSPPNQRFSYTSKGNTNIKSLNWSNKAGTFQIAAFNLPNALVGIDPSKGRQAISLSFAVTPDSNTQFTGKTSFDIIKVSDTEFKH